MLKNYLSCSEGSVFMGHYKTSERLKELQLINGKDITVTKAMYLLGTGVPDKLFRTIFETPLRGEMV